MNPNASPIRHRFVAIDEGLGTLLHVDENQPSHDWIVPLGQPQARDMQLVGNHRLLVSHHHGYSEFDLATGALVRSCTSFAGVTAARRQPDGTLLLAGVQLAGAPGVCVLRLDASDHLMARVDYAGDYVRLIRQTAEGTYLMSCDTRIREATPDGRYLRDYAAPGFRHAWKAVRRPDGHVLVSAGYGAFLVEFDPAGRLVRRWGGQEDVPAEVRPFFYAMLQLLPNEHVVVANWQDHGPGHGASGVQLLEFDRAGAIVWRWSDARRISSLQGVLVLDGLDTARLHDERAGTQEPVPA